MPEPRPRAAVSSPTLVRLLSRVASLDPPSPPALADRLTDWIDWPRGVALYTALDASPDPATGARFDPAVDDECVRARAGLEARIAESRAWTPPKPTADELPDGTAFRKHYVSLQRDIQVVTGRLRGRLRDMLAAAGMTRLAEVDAVMERVLSPRELTLLSRVPDILQAHFERLGSANASPAWVDAFRRDMQEALQAELDVRFQPIEGLLAALRTSTQKTP
ncbi:MAG TPA: DUF3348 family protein [Pseudoxanthomonas sp.]|nr:DUF3348 family protein [Pseudoxanthomonas sp.]